MFSRVALLLLLVWTATPIVSAVAAPRDQTANKEIEAAKQLLQSGDSDGADKALRAVLTTCKNRCSPDVLARVWMYRGLVQGSGLNDQNAARKAFDRALNLDPQVELDQYVTTPDSTKTFARALRDYADEHPAEVASDEGPSQAALLLCTPNVQEVGLRRPVPVACPVAPGSAKTTLYYTADPESEYIEMEMKPVGRQVSATIPCSVTEKIGAILLYVAAKDETGRKDLARWGAPNAPIIIQIVNATQEPPPNLPGMPPPERCSRTPACNPKDPGCVKVGISLKGEPCSQSDECAKGLYCSDFSCVDAPPCTAGSDCPETGQCRGGFCVMELPPGSEPLGDAPEKEKPASSYYVNRVGLHVGLDMAIVSGTEICANQGWEDGFRCYEEGETLITNDPDEQPDFSSDVDTTLIHSSTRLLVSYERVLGDRISVGTRLGYAFGGAPKDYLALHGELYGSYWFASFEEKGLHPYASAGFGLAHVDAKVSVTNRINPGDLTEQYVEYEAYKRMGQLFLKLGGGAAYDLSSSFGVQLNLDAMFMLPATGFVLEPSLGGVLGF